MRDGVFHQRIAAMCGASVFALAGLPLAALAQTAPTREQLTPPTQTITPIAPHKRVDSENVQDFSTCPLDTSSLHVTVSSVNFTGPGGAALPPQIQKVLAGVGPTVQGDAPIREVCDIRDAANSRLRQAGYIASVQIVPQDMSSGALQLAVVTAHFTDIRVHGDPGPYRTLMDDRIAQLMALDPLNELDAERILLVTSDIPGLDIKLSLRSAGTTPGAVIGDLTVARIPYRVQVNVNNSGSEQVGRASAYARLELYGLTGHADVTYLGLSDTFQSREQQVVQLGHTMGIGKRGDTIGASFIYAQSRPDLGTLDLRTDSQVFNVEYYHPFIRTVSKDLLFYAGMDAVEQKTRVLGNNKSTLLNLDKVRVGYLRLTGAMHNPGFAGGDGFTLKGGFEVRQGFSGLGASRPCPTAPGSPICLLTGGNTTDPQAAVVRLNGDTTLGLGSLFTFAGALRTQWSDRSLVNYEKFAVGNLTIGRGYDPGASTADSAVAWRAELRMELGRADKLKGEGFVFYDNARIWNKSHTVCETGAPASCVNDGTRTLASYGAGARFILPGKWVAEVTFAKPLDPALSTKKEPEPPRIMFSITTQFPSSY